MQRQNNNPFTIIPESANAVHAHVYVKRMSSGYIINDNEKKYRMHIKDSAGNPIQIDEEAIYVDIGTVVDGETATNIFPGKFDDLLPSTLFEGCKNDDRIYFTVDDQPFVLLLNQYAKANWDYFPEEEETMSFEAILASIRRRIRDKQPLFSEDNLFYSVSSSESDSEKEDRSEVRDPLRPCHFDHRFGLLTKHAVFFPNRSAPYILRSDPYSYLLSSLNNKTILTPQEVKDFFSNVCNHPRSLKMRYYSKETQRANQHQLWLDFPGISDISHIKCVEVGTHLYLYADIGNHPVQETWVDEPAPRFIWLEMHRDLLPSNTIDITIKDGRVAITTPINAPRLEI